MGVGVLFPGQGAQRAQLGAPWHERAAVDSAWSDVVERAEAVLDRPIALLLLEPDLALDRTEDAQLAVLLASLLAWESARPRLAGAEITAVAGHSLGQMTALIAAGALPFDDGIRLAAARAAHTQAAADRNPGGMVALLGASPDQALGACAAATDSCWIANDNAPGQIVLAGTAEAVGAAAQRAKELGVKRATPLAVDGAFHTPLMGEARQAFAADLDRAPFGPAQWPIVCNTDALPHTDPDGWAARMADHLVSPVRWRECVEALVAEGATELVEVGPGSTLTALAKRIAPGVPTTNIDSPLEVPA